MHGARRVVAAQVSPHYTSPENYRQHQQKKGVEMRYGRYLLACMAAALFLSGCASSSPPRDLNDPTNAMYFGYIDMQDAPTGVTDVNILQIWPPKENGVDPHWTIGMDRGMFLFSTLQPGSYQVTQFVSTYRNAVYDLPRQGNPTSVRMGKPGIYFAGSYKYVWVRTKEGDRFDIKRVSKPSEADLLRRILKYEDISKSAWKGKIEARLAQLKQ